MGTLFLYYGKIKTTIFDKRRNMIVINSTTTFCDKKVKTYRLSDMKSVRAAWRGY